MRHISAPQKGDPDRNMFLNALASLSVCDAHSQVVAVALKRDTRTGKVIICVAENGPVNETVIPHIQKLLDILYKMANEYATLEDKAKITPIIAAYRTKFIKSVYCYSVLKHLHRYEIRWTKFLKNLRQTGLANVMQGADWSMRIFNVVCALDMLRLIHHRINTGSILTHREWLDCTIVLDGAMADINLIRSQYGEGTENPPRSIAPSITLTTMTYHHGRCEWPPLVFTRTLPVNQPTATYRQSRFHCRLWEFIHPYRSGNSDLRDPCGGVSETHPIPGT